MNLKLLLALVTLVIAVIFAIQNADIVNIQFLAWKLPLSLAIVIFLSVALGIVAGWSIGGLMRLRAKSK